MLCTLKLVYAHEASVSCFFGITYVIWNIRFTFKMNGLNGLTIFVLECPLNLFKYTSFETT